MFNVFVLYQFLHPDTVVSSVLMSELCEGLARNGWTVHAFPSNRSCHGTKERFEKEGNWQGVHIHRIWRPAWRQSSTFGRVLNAIWMLVAWTLLAIKRSNEPDILIVGTDPILSVMIAVPWRLFSPRTKIVHWCFDLYPEAAIADGRISERGLLASLLKGVARKGYACSDAIVDIGSCMRERLSSYGTKALRRTLVPWALAEVESVPPSDGTERQQIYDNARLALMYSGSFGRAHSYDELFALLRTMRDDGVKLALSIQGNCRDEVVNAIRSEDFNIKLVPFASLESLCTRLASADIHVITLRKQWTGMVVPSKFFGALAIGRPVLFCGSEDSAIAHWIRQYGVGWVLSSGSVSTVAKELRELIANRAELSVLQERCRDVYVEHFSRRSVLKGWDELLHEVIEARSAHTAYRDLCGMHDEVNERRE